MNLKTNFDHFSNFYSVKNSVFSEDNMLTKTTKIFDIQQKFGVSSDEVEGALRYLMNFIGNNPQEVFICLALKNTENIRKEALDEMKEVLVKIPIFAAQ